MDEREAVDRLRRGDIGGLESLVDRYYVRAVRTALLITRDRPLAEDAAQEAFIRAYERIEGFDPSRQFGPWLLRIVANGALNAVARHGRESSLDAGSLDALHPAMRALADLAPSPEAVLEQAELRERVRAALDALPPEQRHAIVLRYYLDMSEEDMASELHSPRGTVKWRLHAARKRLHTLLRS